MADQDIVMQAAQALKAQAQQAVSEIYPNGGVKVGAILHYAEGANTSTGFGIEMRRDGTNPDGHELWNRPGDSLFHEMRTPIERELNDVLSLSTSSRYTGNDHENGAIREDGIYVFGTPEEVLSACQAAEAMAQAGRTGDGQGTHIAATQLSEGLTAYR